MKSIEHLLAFPHASCRDSAEHCPLLRTCPVCKYRFITVRGRRQHQNGCAGTLDALMVAAQHVHERAAHQGRARG